MLDIYDESTLQDVYFTTKEMKRIFSDANRIQKQMDCEAALADTEAELGLIPREAADEIMRKSNVEYIDFAALREDLIKTGHPFVALVHAYKKICDGNAGEYVHWGATTQDILDTAAILQAREAYRLVFRRTEDLYRIIADQAYRYKDLVMAGRTNGQQAMPITFGYKLAVWGFELRDTIDRLKESEKRVFKGEFAGAVGTMASLEPDGLRVQEGFLKRLDLAIPAIAWSSSRNHNAELMNNLAILAATLGKIGTEVYALQKSEIGELEEKQGQDAIGSSTMPHKRNPFRAMELSTNAKLIRGCASVMMESLETEHERDPRSASVENLLLQQIFSLTHSSIERAVKLVDNLVVYPEHMRRNINALHGLMFSEAVMMALGKTMGRQNAHALVHELAMKAFQEETPLRDLLLQNQQVSEVLSQDDLDNIMKPENYLGKSAYFAEKLKQQADDYFLDHPLAE